MEDEKELNANQETTLATYEAGVQKYIDETPSEVNGEFKEYIDSFLAKIPTGGQILEIGSATGRDADYIESKGYKVLRTDVVDGFIEYQKANGKDVEKYNAIDGDLERQFDLIIATAVFLHFDKGQFVQAVRNTARHLYDGGYFAIALKQGEGEEYSEAKMESPRYFKYWSDQELRKILESEGFTIEQMSEAGEGKWINCLAKKT